VDPESTEYPSLETQTQGPLSEGAFRVPAAAHAWESAWIHSVSRAPVSVGLAALLPPQ
jgi:hypothetical protein